MRPSGYRLWRIISICNKRWYNGSVSAAQRLSSAAQLTQDQGGQGSECKIVHFLPQLPGSVAGITAWDGEPTPTRQLLPFRPSMITQVEVNCGRDEKGKHHRDQDSSDHRNGEGL